MAALAPASESRVVDMSLIERVRAKLAKLPPSVGEVIHTFTPGLYCRRILMAAGSQHLSKIHKTRHQFFIMQGACLVSENGAPPKMYVAPYHGITEPGTWRELFIVMDCVWITAHPTSKTTVEEVEKEIIQPMEEAK